MATPLPGGSIIHLTQPVLKLWETPFEPETRTRTYSTQLAQSLGTNEKICRFVKERIGIQRR